MSEGVGAKIRLAAFLARSTANGPGTRAVIWVQGCSLPLCPGCFNPGFLDPRRPAEEIAPEELIARVLAVPGLRGVTFSGGEPFDQADTLAQVARRLRGEGLDVVVFTGNTLRALRDRSHPGVDALLSETDLLVAGPYRREEPCSEPLRSSQNQQLHFFGRIQPSELSEVDTVELTLDLDGKISMTGFPAPDLAATLRRSPEVGMGSVSIVSPAHGARLSSPLAIARIRCEGLPARGSVRLDVGDVPHILELPEGYAGGVIELRENITLLEGDNTLVASSEGARAEVTVAVPPSSGITLSSPPDSAPHAARAAELRGSFQGMSCPAGVVSINGFLQQFSVSGAEGSFDERIVLKPGANHLAVQVGERYVTRKITGLFPAAKILATLVWDTSGTDIDLYVGEPDGSFVWYGNKAANGTLDVDRMQGFGPENYSVVPERAKPGRYEVRTHYFAARGVGRSEWTIRVITDEGLPSQKRRTFYGILDRSLGHQGPSGRGEDWDDVCEVHIDEQGLARIEAQGGARG